MFGLGFFEMLVILVVVLLVVGPEKLPELSRTMGRTMWQLRRAADEFRSEISVSGLDVDAKGLRRELDDLRSIVYEDPRKTLRTTELKKDAEAAPFVPAAETAASEGASVPAAPAPTDSEESE